MTVKDPPPQFIDLICAYGRKSETAFGPQTSIPRSTSPAGISREDHAATPVGQLKASRLRPTIARIEVLSAIAGSVPPCLDALELFRILSARRTHPGQSSIYRALNDLQEAGLLTRVDNPGGRALYTVSPANNGATNVAVRCRCGARLAFIQDATLHKHLNAVSGQVGFESSGNTTFTVTIHSEECKNCREPQQARTGNV